MKIEKRRTDIELRLVDTHTFGDYLTKWFNKEDVPKCMFLSLPAEDSSIIEAADNSDGNFSVENLKTYEEAIAWILGDDIEDIWKRRENIEQKKATAESLKIAAYFLLERKSANSLSSVVTNLINNEGYIPFGSPFTEKGLFYQAMVKYEEVKDE